MLDLKAKLLQAGLVTEDQVEKAEHDQETEKAQRKARREAQQERSNQGRRGQGQRGQGQRGQGRRGGGGKNSGASSAAQHQPRGPAPSSEELEAKRWRRRIEQLKATGKSEQYETIRKWVERTRLDAVKGIPSKEAERFHFDKGEGSIGRLTVEPDLAKKLKDGEAGIIAFMGFNGRAWCAVPRDMALDVHQIRPDWLRSLANFEFELIPLEATGKKAKKNDDATDASTTDATATDATATDATATDATATDAAATEAAGGLDAVEAPVVEAPVVEAPVVNASGQAVIAVDKASEITSANPETAVAKPAPSE